MKYTMMPVIWVGDLEEALKLQYGPDFLTWEDNLRNILFGDSYCNDVSKQLNILDTEEWDDSYAEFADERHMRIANCAKTFLQDLFPGQEYVMIDVMW